MSLKSAIETRIRQEVLQPMADLGDWKVLVLDGHATKIIDACFKMVDLAQYKITLVEDISKSREAVPLSAIYLIAPEEESIVELQNDFTMKEHRYQSAHVFFTKNCSDTLLREISRSYCFAYLRTLKEVDLDFIMMEPHVFHLNADRESLMYWRRMMAVPKRDYHLKRTAERLVTVCSALGINPQIRFFSKSVDCKMFANLVQVALDNLVRRDPKSMSLESNNERSILLILDRGFDPISPILHELTFQAMVHDVLNVDRNDIIKLDNDREFSLKEGNKIWDDMKYSHIGEVASTLPQMLKDFKQRRNIKDQSGSSPGEVEMSSSPTGSQQVDRSKLRELNQMVKRMPQYKREMETYSSLFSMAESCMNRFTHVLKHLCLVEQEYIMQKTVEGDDIKDMFARFNEVLKYDLSNVEKLRLLLLFIIVKGGLAAETPQKMLEYADLPASDMDIINNMVYLQIPVIITEPERGYYGESWNLLRSPRIYPPFQESQEVKKSISSASYMAPQRRSCDEREVRNAYSRWIPYLQDILQGITGNSLSLTDFPIMESQNNGSVALNMIGGAHFSVRTTGQQNYGLNLEDEMSQRNSHNLDLPGGSPKTTSPFTRRRQARSKLIVFILGGVTFSEVRCTALMNKENDSNAGSGIGRTATFSGNRPREVILGGTHILTPQRFIEDLKELSKFGEE